MKRKSRLVDTGGAQLARSSRAHFNTLRAARLSINKPFQKLVRTAETEVQRRFTEAIDDNTAFRSTP